MYFKESLLLIRRSDLSDMKELDELESFCSSIDSLLSNINDQHPAYLIVIGEFNAKSSKWCTSDKDSRT